MGTANVEFAQKEFKKIINRLQKNNKSRERFFFISIWNEFVF